MVTTFPKAIAAVFWAALFWVTSELLKPAFPDGFNPGRFSEINVIYGAIVGWSIVGARAGGGYVNGISYGVTASVFGVIMGLFFNCLMLMIDQSTNVGFYAGPVDAVVGVFEEMIEYGALFLKPEAYRADAVLIGGSAVLGIVVEYISRRTS